MFVTKQTAMSKMVENANPELAGNIRVDVRLVKGNACIICRRLLLPE